MTSSVFESSLRVADAPRMHDAIDGITLHMEKDVAHSTGGPRRGIEVTPGSDQVLAIRAGELKKPDGSATSTASCLSMSETD